MLAVRDLRICAHATLLSLGAAAIGACSVYDARRLSSQAEHSLAGSAGAPASDAVIDCQDEGFAQCLRTHADARCVDGTCIITRCLDGYVDCDTESDNGCETRLDTLEHCGRCGAACRMNRGSARCDDGTCELVGCDDGYGNCDDDPDNGCETSLKSRSDCGVCGRSCPALANAVAGCSDGECGIISCSGRFADCNETTSDGCEQSLTSTAHCGACEASCEPRHGTGSCESGACVVTTCDAGWRDCNGLASDGCETPTNSIEHCGACGRRCELPHVARSSCTATGACTIDRSCDSEDRGCEPDAKTNGCDAGFSDCDGDPANGCETDLSRLNHCGSCDNSCVVANAETACRDGQCVFVGCAPGTHRCGESSECRSLAGDPQNCGECGRECTVRQCAGGRCTSEMCRAGRADCDGGRNGCETDLTTVENCGSCGVACPALPNATGACRANGCAIGACEPGFLDCDGAVANGCEVDIRSTDDCNGCATPCFAPNAVTSCSTGRCQIMRCDSDRGDCNESIDDGCEANLRLPDTCGACENVCMSLPNVDSSSCEDATCRLVCGTGRADCDGRTANGCEADLADAMSCGRCGNDCDRLANVRAATCADGNCQDIVCDGGYADCNGDPTDGCEQSLQTTSDCGACNRACAPARSEGSCATGSCELAGCDAGFEDCNRDAADGCETAVTTNQNCGGCGNVCSEGIQCTNGRCGCASDADCAEGLTCCERICANTRTACFLWPCLPGLEVRESRSNCGGCGEICLLWCCLG